MTTGSERHQFAQTAAQLKRLREHNLLEDLDCQLAMFLMQEADQPSLQLALAIALTCRATDEGHLCLDLDQHAQRTLLPGIDPTLRTPPLDEWRSALLDSGVVGSPGSRQPLVLDDQQRLYLHRYWDYEQRLASALLQRAADPGARVDRVSLSAGLKQLFQPPEGLDTDWQQVAAANALLANLTVISGGPGTGKTSTVVRILALLRQQPGGSALRIGLAAPTGMAAARLQQSIRDAKLRLPLSAEEQEKIPEQASTLHRLLGVTNQGTGFRHHAENPLLLDVLILDEASMVDVALMAKLLDALPSQARLILLGDRDQLASVEAGAVLGDICNGCEGPGTESAATLAQITGQPIEPLPRSDNPLQDRVVLLHHSYRFSAESPIGCLASAINRAEADQAIRLIQRGSAQDELTWLADEAETLALGAAHFAQLGQAIERGDSVEALFEQLHAFRILAALREGPAGVIQLNQGITGRLRAQGAIPQQASWYVGRPVMLTRNDYQLNLYNGETGIVLAHPDGSGELSVAFNGADGAIRWVSPSRLPHCETVYALTVHKSQGSEFQRVLFHLPKQDSPVLCRELVYTAVTRAKQQFSLVGTEAVFKTALLRGMQRQSGLSDRLQRFS
ncbi:MAG: exodeoxyribonuclease V subunit alpha [Candidatus Thiodiazotropha lotti]|nr:exodeoxyribonuclease V subunit alpha [Candidatus Thiodiazotropha lotti]MCG8001007.1 exodeoxyribonuclease V subunit alpha [Candidatus Thiodiazotropha lotti]MCW4182665.1 exodeoxyribonuclease V subunit alpha [Candidatus Thiodiazotropha weberae]MCW4192780.1 exodeoxyribonuclease V subunit alpha [Candidatus Thiodiazotropha weberae]